MRLEFSTVRRKCAFVVARTMRVVGRKCAFAANNSASPELLPKSLHNSIYLRFFNEKISL